MHNEEMKELTNKEKIQSIMLNVIEEKDIYVAWEKAYHDDIDNYKIEATENDSESTVKAEKVSWLETLPHVMILQMNRVKFENDQPVKTSHVVPILPEIYPDRFQMEHRKEVDQLNA